MERRRVTRTFHEAETRPLEMSAVEVRAELALIMHQFRL